MKTKIIMIFCLSVLSLSACVIDLSDDDTIRPMTYKQSLKAMSDRAFEDCGRGNIQSVSNTNYSCFNKQLNQQNSNDFKAIEELALKTCKGAVKEISATGFVCE